MINLDITVVIQLINFIITLIVLNYLLIRPIRQIIKKRADSMGELSTEAREFADSAREKLTGYEAAMAEARKDAVAKREEFKLAGQKEEKDIVSAAHDKASAFLDNARAETRAQAQAALGELKAQVEPLAKEAAAKVLA